MTSVPGLMAKKTEVTGLFTELPYLYCDPDFAASFFMPEVNEPLKRICRITAPCAIPS